MDDIQQLSQIRANALEQFAQVQSELDILTTQRHKLKKRAGLLLEDLRNLTAKINELSAKPEKEKAHDVSAQAETSPG